MFRLTFLLIFLLLLAACTPTAPSGDAAAVQPTRPAATAVTTFPTDTPVPTAVTTLPAPSPTNTPVPTPTVDLETAVPNLDYAAPPPGLVYTTYGEGVYQVQPDDQRRQLLDAETANIPNLQVSPDDRFAAYIDDNGKLRLINTTTGEQQPFATDHTLSGYLSWGDNDTLFLGVWLKASEAEGPNIGHIATLDVPSGDLVILDEAHLSGNQPSMLSDYNWVAFDIFPASQGDIVNGRLYHPDSGLQIFDHTAFAGNTGNPIFNPAWSPEPSQIAWMSYSGERRVVQVFDMEAKTAVTVFDWDPAQFGGLVPSPVWSSGGKWLALEVLANNSDESGLWLIAVDGSSQTRIDAQGQDPHWVNNNQLIFSVNGSAHLYYLDSGQLFGLNVPDGSKIWGITEADDLAALETAEATPPAENSEAEPNYPDPADLAMTETQEASPDGRWQAIAAQSEPIVVGDAEKLYVSLTVSDGTTTWTPVAEWRGYGLGYIWPAVYRWSADGHYLYYTNLSSPDGCLYYSNGTDLYRLDVTDGSVNQIFPDGKTGNISLSADESTLAYTSYDGQSVLFVIRDLATDAERSAEITISGDYAQTGRIYWSADGDTAVLTLFHNACNLDESTSIVHINLGDMTATTLIAKDDRFFQIQDWPNPEQVQIRLVDKDGNTWWLEINSGELTPE